MTGRAGPRIFSSDIISGVLWVNVRDRRVRGRKTVRGRWVMHARRQTATRVVSGVPLTSQRRPFARTPF